MVSADMSYLALEEKMSDPLFFLFFFYASSSSSSCYGRRHHKPNCGSAGLKQSRNQSHRVLGFSLEMAQEHQILCACDHLARVKEEEEKENKEGEQGREKEEEEKERKKKGGGGKEEKRR